MAFEFNDDNIKQVIESGKPVMVDFWGTHCGPCKKMAPIVDELADEFADKVIIGKYNTEEYDDFAVSMRIMAVPVFMFFKNGEQVRDLKLVGAKSKDQLKANLEKLLAL